MDTKRIHSIGLWALLCVAATALAAYLLLVAFSTFDTLDVKFRSYQEAATAGVIERGIVPRFLPLSASEIHVEANLDGGGVVVKFAFGPDFDTFLTKQKQSPGVTPKSLGINGYDKNFSSASELIYIPNISSTDESGAGYLLVHPKKRRAMYVKARHFPGKADNPTRADA